MRSGRKTSIISDQLIQTDIWSGLKNLKRLSEKQLIKKTMMYKKNTQPNITITISSDEEGGEVTKFPARNEKRKLAFPLSSSDDEDLEDSKVMLNIDKNLSQTDNQSCTLNTSKKIIASESPIINIIQNTVITPNKITKPQNNNEEASKVTKISRNEENIRITLTPNYKQPSSTDVNPLNKTPPKSPQKIAKQENKQLNPNFLKAMNELVSMVFDSRFLLSLLSEEETKILKVVTTSRQEYQYICFKLYMWLPHWYNLFSFCKKNHCNLSDNEVISLFNLMKENDIIETDWKNEELVVLLKLLSYQHIKDICLSLHLSGKTKTDMIMSILTYCNKQMTITFSKSTKDIVLENIMKKLGKYVVKITDTFQNILYNIFLLNTFTNPKLQDKNKYFRNIQEIDFPEYTIQDHIVFYTREDFINYSKACRFRDVFEELTAKDNKMFLLGNEVFTFLKDIQKNYKEDNRFQTVPHLKRFTALAVYIKLLTKISSSLKINYFEEVECWLKYLIKNFPKSRYFGDWCLDISALTLRQLKDPNIATMYIIDAFLNKDYLTEVQIQNLAEKGKQLKNMKNVTKLTHDSLAEILPVIVTLEDFPQVTIDAKTVRGNSSGKKRHYWVQNNDGSKEFKSVEQIALDFYERCGYTQGEHCEGTIIMATFALFFWDIIYYPKIVVPGTFLSNIQQFPLDMYSTYFYLNRKQLIDKRLNDLAVIWSDDETISFVTENWVNYSHKEGICKIDNIITNKEMLQSIVKCIGRKTLSDIYGRLVKDVGQYRSGMPDLLVWDEKESKAKFIEVKGENDKLSVKQKLWLQYLKTIGANIEVCHVHSIGSKKKIKSKLEQKTISTGIAGLSKSDTSTAKKKELSKKQYEDDGTDSSNDFSDSFGNSTTKKKKSNNYSSTDDFESPPTSPPIKKKFTKKSTTPTMKGSSSCKNNGISSTKKRRIVSQKSVEDTYKKSKSSTAFSDSSSRMEPDKEKSSLVEKTVVDTNSSNSSLISTRESPCNENIQATDPKSSTVSKMTQTNNRTIICSSKENVALKPVNTKVVKMTTYRRLFS